ncbi:MAG: amidohydrolase family protein [Alphaproteobacteria bacterium]|nr:amidohydrolase family protein [Alphaproteobacteria bacterium]
MPTGIIFDWVGAPEPVIHQMWEPVWAAAAETGLPVNLHANPRGGSRQIGVGAAGLEPRNQSLMTVMNFLMGLMAELMSAVVLSGICDRHRGIRFVLEEAGVGWVPFLFWRMDREYEFGGPTRVFKPDIELARLPSEIVREHLFFTFEVEEEGGFRRVPEIGMGNFLWASDFPGLDSPWPNSKAEGHAPAEAALGKDTLSQLVFQNAVNLYKLPVTLPQS